MGTRSTTTIFDERNKPLISFYIHFLGYFEHVGANLQKFLKKRIEENDYNSMGCLAAQVIKEFKTEEGGFYIINNHDQRESFYYEIKLGSNDKLNLTGTNCLTGKVKKFPLYDEVTPKERVVFKYSKDGCGGNTQFRDVMLIEEDANYIMGLDSDDNNRFKKFSKKNIVGEILRGKIVDQ